MKTWQERVLELSKSSLRPCEITAKIEPANKKSSIF